MDCRQTDCGVNEPTMKTKVVKFSTYGIILFWIFLKIDERFGSCGLNREHLYVETAQGVKAVQ